MHICLSFGFLKLVASPNSSAYKDNGSDIHMITQVQKAWQYNLFANYLI